VTSSRRGPDVRRILVIGGTSGIGLACARRFAGPATRIIVNGRSVARGEAACAAVRSADPGSDISFISADVTTHAGARALYDEAIASLGSLDVVVNSAGGALAPTLFHENDLDMIDSVLKLWLASTMYSCRLAMPHLSAGGSIVNVASDAAKVPTPGEAAIGGAMAGIAMFSRTLAMEAKRRGIRVNVVTPSLVQGTMTYETVMSTDFSTKLFGKAIKAAHLGLCEPDDVAAMIEFLSGPEASKITGQVVSVNGGISAG
jgi:2-hydroxycyclohexanecarboxyl-CoA dehydrogenase